MNGWEQGHKVQALLDPVSSSRKGKTGLGFPGLQPPKLHALLEGCRGECVGPAEQSPVNTAGGRQGAPCHLGDPTTGLSWNTPVKAREPERRG